MNIFKHLAFAPDDAMAAEAAIVSEPVTAVEAPVEASAPAPAPEAPAEAGASKEFTPSLLEVGVKESAPPEGEAPPAETKEAPPAEAPKEEGKEEKPEGEPASKETPSETLEPISYDLKFPETVDPAMVNQDVIGEYKGVLAEIKAPPEVAQKLLDMHINTLREATTKLAEAQWDVFNRQQEAWKQEVLSDPVLGGSRHQTAMKECGSFIQQFGGSSEEIKAIWDVMSSTGAGNNPHIVRMIHRAAMAMAVEGSPRPAPPPKTPQLSRDQKMQGRYGT